MITMGENMVLQGELVVQLLNNEVISGETLSNYKEKTLEEYKGFEQYITIRVFKLIKEFIIQKYLADNTIDITEITRKNVEVINNFLMEVDVNFYTKLITAYAKNENPAINIVDKIELLEECVSLNPQNAYCKAELYTKLLSQYMEKPFDNKNKIENILLPLKEAIAIKSLIPQSLY